MRIVLTQQQIIDIISRGEIVVYKGRILRKVSDVPNDAQILVDVPNYAYTRIEGNAKGILGYSIFGSPSDGNTLLFDGTNLRWIFGTQQTNSGANPAGTGNEIQYRANSTTLGALAGSIARTTGEIVFAPPARSGSTFPLLQILTPQDTALTSGTETIGVQIGGDSSKSSVVRTWNTGDFAIQRENLFVAPTYACNGSAFTIFNAATVAITGAPIAGTQMVLTDSWSLWSQSGASAFQRDSIGTTSTDGIVLRNMTAASAGAQQYSPRLRFTGYGWKTSATASSQMVDWIIENRPVQGSSNPSTGLYFASQINGGGYNSIASFNNLGTSSQFRFGIDLSEGFNTYQTGIGVADFIAGGNPVFRLVATQVNLASNTTLGWTNGVPSNTADLILRRVSSANIALGAADAASPVAQTFSVQNVVNGTTNTAGVDFTIKGSAGTGTGAGGNIIFQTSASGSTGSTQNSFTSVLTLNSAGGVVANSVNGFTNSNQGVNSIKFQLAPNGLGMTSSSIVSWAPGNTYGNYGDVFNVADTSISRSAAAVIRVGNGSTGIGGILIGTSTDTGSAGTLYVVRNNITTTSTDSIVLANNTAAVSGTQQYSPRLRFTGQGWKTAATAASQTVDWIIENQPVQGTANPTTTLVFSTQVNGSGYSKQVVFGTSSVGGGNGYVGDGSNYLQYWSNSNVSLEIRNASDSSYQPIRASAFYTSGIGYVANQITGSTGGFEINQTSFRGASQVINLYSTSGIAWNSTTNYTSPDLFLRRAAAANLAFGAADAASPVAQTLSVQNVVAGTTNTAGSNFTIAGSQGTGTGAGGSIIFQTAPAGSSGTAQNPLVTALTINSVGQILAGNGTQSLPAFSFSGSTNSGLYNNGGNVEIVEGGRRSLVVQSGGVGIYLGGAANSQILFGSSINFTLRSNGANNLVFGSADSATPSAQTLAVQNVVAGTLNTAGANWTFNGSIGTGTGSGGSIIFQTAPAGTTGTVQNSYVAALTINGDGSTTFPTPTATLAGANGVLRLVNDTSGILRPGLWVTGNGTCLATYGNGGVGNGAASYQAAAITRALGVGFSSLTGFSSASSDNNGTIVFANNNNTGDAYFRRAAAANLMFGASDAAAPVAQTLSVQNVLSGTTDTAGVNWTFKGSASTGTGVGGNIIFQVTPPAGSTATTQNTFATVLQLSPGASSSTAGILITSGTAPGTGSSNGGATISPLSSNTNENLRISGKGTGLPVFPQNSNGDAFKVNDNGAVDFTFGTGSGPSFYIARSNSGTQTGLAVLTRGASTPFVVTGSGGGFGWMTSTSFTEACDTGMVRSAANVIRLNTGYSSGAPTTGAGGLLIGTSTDTGSAATLTVARAGIGTTSTDGIILTNTTAAAVGAQQYSPRLRLTGQGWKTNATAASQTVDWIVENQPVQGAANPSSNLVFSYQINGGGYTRSLSLLSDTFSRTLIDTQSVAIFSNASTTAFITRAINNISMGFPLAGLLVWGADVGNTNYDLVLRRAAAANLALGATDAASPVAQTISVQNVVAGTSNTAGVDWTFKASASTGSANGGSIIFQTTPAGTSGTSQNTYSNAGIFKSDLSLWLGTYLVLGNGVSSQNGAISYDSTNNTHKLTRNSETVTLNPPVVTLTDAATINTDASKSDKFRVTLGGNRTLANPTNMYDGQQLLWEIIQDATGNRTLALDTMFTFGTDVTSYTASTTANKRDFITGIYNAGTGKIYVTRIVKGY